MMVGHDDMVPGYVRGFFRDKVVAVTGAAGSVGSELIRQLLGLDVASIIGLDNDENGIFKLDNALGDPRVRTSYCDISGDRLKGIFDGVDFVFHAAALKHVYICERSPLAAVDVNVRGLISVMEAAMEARVQRVVFTSSDKAVNPTNVMGASKLLGERIAVSFNLRNGFTRVSCTRFGNVAGSRGSVIPLFADQILSGGAITLTAPEMTRFFMTLSDSVRLIIDSMIHARGGETFVTKMETIRIKDLAETMVEILAPVAGRNPADVPVTIIGPRMGEKLYEELTTDEEQSRTYEFERYLVVQPVEIRHSLGEHIGYDLLGRAPRVTKPYNSRLESVLDSKAIAAFLLDNQLLPVAPGRA